MLLQFLLLLRQRLHLDMTITMRLVKLLSLFQLEQQ